MSGYSTARYRALLAIYTVEHCSNAKGAIMQAAVIQTALPVVGYIPPSVASRNTYIRLRAVYFFSVYFAASKQYNWLGPTLEALIIEYKYPYLSISLLLSSITAPATAPGSEVEVLLPSIYVLLSSIREDSITRSLSANKETRIYSKYSLKNELR